MIKSAGRIVAGGLVAAATLASAPAHAGKTLDAIKAARPARLRREHRPAGFSAADSQGNWTGLDVDICKARCRRRARRRQQGQVRAAQRAAALHRAAVGRGRHPVAQHHLDPDARRLAGPVLHRRRPTTTARASWCRKSKIKSAKELKGATVCVQSGTTTEKNLTDYSRGNNLEHQAGRVREGGGRHRGVLLRPLPGLHDRRLGPRFDPQQGGQATRTTT